MRIHPQIIEKEGKKEFVILPYEEFIQLQEEIENYEDLKYLRGAKEAEKNASTLPLSELKRELDI